MTAENNNFEEESTESENNNNKKENENSKNKFLLLFLLLIGIEYIIFLNVNNEELRENNEQDSDISMYNDEDHNNESFNKLKNFKSSLNRNSLLNEESDCESVKINEKSICYKNELESLSFISSLYNDVEEESCISSSLSEEEIVIISDELENMSINNNLTLKKKILFFKKNFTLVKVITDYEKIFKKLKNLDIYDCKEIPAFIKNLIKKYKKLKNKDIELFINTLPLETIIKFCGWKENIVNEIKETQEIKYKKFLIQQGIISDNKENNWQKIFVDDCEELINQNEKDLIENINNFRNMNFN